MNFLSRLLGNRVKQESGNLRIFVVCLICFKPDRPNFQYTHIVNCLSPSLNEALKEAKVDTKKRIGADLVISDHKVEELPFEMIEKAYLSGLAGGQDA